MKLSLNRYWSGILTGTLCACVIAGAFHAGLLEIMEFKTLDHRFRHMPHWKESASPANIGIVVIDQTSLEKVYRTIGQRWKWPREFYAKITGFLYKAGAKAVIFDMYFTEPDIDRVDISGAESDAALVDATRFASNTFHTYILQRYGLAPQPDKLNAILTKSVYPEEIPSATQAGLLHYRTGALPSPALTAASAGIGFATLEPERDNICRRIQLVATISNRTVMCQSLASAYGLLGKPHTSLDPHFLDIGGYRISTDSSASAYLWWYRPPPRQQSVFPHYSAFNLLRAAVLLDSGQNPQLDLAGFKDKIIYIGSTAPGLLDAWATPLSGAVPGVEIQATALANILQHHFVKRIPAKFTYVAIILLCLLVAIYSGSGLHRHPSGMLIPLALLAVTITAGYTLLATHHIFIDIIPPSLSIVLTFGITTIINYLSERRHSRLVRGIFEHYLDHAVVDNLIANPEQVRLGGEVRECTVLFSDIANFTGISEQLSPEQVVHFMNIYLNAMTDIIIDEGGFVDKFIGDEIIAIFGAPNILPDHASRACRSILKMNEKVAELQPQFREAGCTTEIFARTGICTGDVVIGNMGSDTRMNYTAMGNTMNLGSRIEGINKIYGTRTLTNQATVTQSGMLFREIDLVQVKGKQHGERIFELAGSPASPSMPLENIKAFENALCLYRQRRWDSAAAEFSKLAELGDAPAATFMQRCQQYAQTPPPPDWDTCFIMPSK
jgi:adenylate cyclase